VAAQQAVRDAVRTGEICSAHDIAEGGLAVALAECCLAGGLGAEVVLDASADPTAALFGEGSGGFLLSGSGEALRALGARLPVRLIGTVGGERLTISVEGAPAIDAPLGELAGAHEGGLVGYFP
jgi:phosphoribosylformylglycinamidine synthase